MSSRTNDETPLQQAAQLACEALDALQTPNADFDGMRNRALAALRAALATTAPAGAPRTLRSQLIELTPLQRALLTTSRHCVIPGASEASAAGPQPIGELIVRAGQEAEFYWTEHGMSVALKDGDYSLFLHPPEHS